MQQRLPRQSDSHKYNNIIWYCILYCTYLCTRYVLHKLHSSGT